MGLFAVKQIVNRVFCELKNSLRVCIEEILQIQIVDSNGDPITSANPLPTKLEDVAINLGDITVNLPDTIDTRLRDADGNLYTKDNPLPTIDSPRQAIFVHDETIAQIGESVTHDFIPGTIIEVIADEGGVTITAEDGEALGLEGDGAPGYDDYKFRKIFVSATGPAKFELFIQKKPSAAFQKIAVLFTTELKNSEEFIFEDPVNVELGGTIRVVKTNNSLSAAQSLYSTIVGVAVEVVVDEVP